MPYASLWISILRDQITLPLRTQVEFALVSPIALVYYTLVVIGCLAARVTTHICLVPCEKGNSRDYDGIHECDASGSRSPAEELMSVRCHGWGKQRSVTYYVISSGKSSRARIAGRYLWERFRSRRGERHTTQLLDGRVHRHAYEIYCQLFRDHNDQNTQSMNELTIVL